MITKYMAEGRVAVEAATDECLTHAMGETYPAFEALEGNPNGGTESIEAAEEWLRRYPTPESGLGWKWWKGYGDRRARELTNRG